MKFKSKNESNSGRSFFPREGSHGRRVEWDDEEIDDLILSVVNLDSEFANESRKSPWKIRDKRRVTPVFQQPLDSQRRSKFELKAKIF